METLELIRDIYSKQQELDDISNKMKEMAKQVEDLTASINSEKKELLDYMLTTKKPNDDGVLYVPEIDEGDLVASYFCKSEFSYGDEKALLSKLQEMKLDNYVKVTTKTTTSLDKVALKKDLKTNNELRESLKDYVGDRSTEYVVVTTSENHEKMSKHIEESMKKNS